jgi:hypothetical protein
MHGKLRVVQLVILAQKLMTLIFPFKFITTMKRIFPMAAGKFRVKIQTFPGVSVRTYAISLPVIRRNFPLKMAT